MLARSYADHAENLRYLDWKRGVNGYEGYAQGRLRFSIMKEPRGWMLYRFTERSGQVVFKSKEAVSSLAGGRAYANALGRLSNLPPLPSSPRRNRQ